MLVLVFVVVEVVVDVVVVFVVSPRETTRSNVEVRKVRKVRKVGKVRKVRQVGQVRKVIREILRRLGFGDFHSMLTPIPCNNNDACAGQQQRHWERPRGVC